MRVSKVKLAALALLLCVAVLEVGRRYDWQWPAGGNWSPDAAVPDSGAGFAKHSDEKRPPTGAGEDWPAADLRADYNSLTCRFPLLEPWDETLTPFLRQAAPLNCPRTQFDLTFVDELGILRYNVTEYRRAEQEHSTVLCRYMYFDKAPSSNDNSVTYVDGGHQLNFPESVRLDFENVEVKCYKSAKQLPDDEIYWNVHAHPLRPEDGPTPENEGDKLSVLVLGMDSLSLSAFRRHLPRTCDYARNVMRFRMFHGHHKIGDNSFPNQLAVLSGKRVVDEQSDMMSEMEEESEYRAHPFDDWTLIWQQFREKGFETSFNEDTPHWGLFHYHAKGFSDKPVDHYYHQFWLALRKGEHRFAKHCFGNRAKLQMQLDLIRRHYPNFASPRRFDYVFMTELFHMDEGYEAEKADRMLYELLSEMHSQHRWNQTMVVLLSDHGHRYASLRQTLVGLLEERLPLLAVWMPDWFYRQHPLLDVNLRRNTVRLTSHFDVHETLSDASRGAFESFQRPVGSRGLSLFYPIRADRTCQQAGVPEHYCTCLSEQPLRVNDSRVRDAAAAAVDHLNRLLVNSSASCARLSLLTLVRAELLGVHEKVAMGVAGLKSAQEFDSRTSAPAPRPLNKLRLTFKTTPGGALFEAVVAWNDVRQRWTVDGRINRLNSYAATSYCIDDPVLVKYCICFTTAAAPRPATAAAAASGRPFASPAVG